jgi:DNA-binding response OmpR family regulator
LPNLDASLLKKGYEIEVLGDVKVFEHLDNGASPGDTDLGTVDLVIIDVSGGADGDVSCHAVGRACPHIPLILLVAEDAPDDPECRKLTCGNVLRLPFTARKVVNRVRKLMDGPQSKVLQVGDLTLNLATRCVYRGDTFHRLTPRQAQLLEVFMRNAGRTLTRKHLMESVWNTDYMGDTRTLDVHVRWIRERIEEDPSSPKYLRTVRGIGYRFGAPSES